MKQKNKRKLIWCVIAAIGLAAFYLGFVLLAHSNWMVNAIVILLFAAVGLGNVVYELFMLADKLVDKICGEEKVDGC